VVYLSGVAVSPGIVPTPGPVTVAIIYSVKC